MTSNAATDSSSTGVVLYDTRDTSGRFYPLTGLGVGTNVTTAFESSPLNIRGYSAANVQLYQIYGEPTWVATFVKDNTFGQSFQAVGDRKSTRLNSSHQIISYAVFCLKKKNKTTHKQT